MNGKMKTGLRAFAMSAVVGVATMAMPCSGAQDRTREGLRIRPQPLQMQSTQPQALSPQFATRQPLTMQQAPCTQLQFGHVQVQGRVFPTVSPQRIPFERPLAMDPGGAVRPFQTSPWGKGTPNAPPGGLPMPEDPSSGWGGGFKGLPNRTPWGGGWVRSDWGNGIADLHDGEGTPIMPNPGKDLPQGGIRPNVGPDKDGADGGLYGNFHPKSLVSKTGNWNGAVDGVI